MVWSTVRRLVLSATRKYSTTPTGSRKTQKTIQEKGYILLVIPAAGFCLGTWQVQRRQWKLSLIDDLEKKTRAEPIPFPDNLSDLEDLEYRRVRLRGTYDYSKELYIMPRGLITPDSDQGGGGLISVGKSQSGAHVITPLQLTDRNERILVNRGWIPREKMRADKRNQGQVLGEVEFVGVVRKTEKRAQFAAANDPATNQWFNRDIVALSRVLGTEPAFIDADHKSTVSGGPIGGQTRVTLRNEHMSYIFTWFSLTAITSLMWYKRYWKIK